MVRSVAISAFTRVFDALWQRVSNHGAARLLRVRRREISLRDGPAMTEAKPAASP